MPRKKEPPRVWGRPDRPGSWVILDGGRQFSAGLGPSPTDREKEEALRKYLAKKHGVQSRKNVRDPSEISVADVLRIYYEDVVQGHARPNETKARIAKLRKFFGGMTLDKITGAICREYARGRGSSGRRELEDLRSAINYHRREGLHDRIVSVVLPAKAKPRETWLTRSEAAKLILTAWRYREKQGGPMAGRRTRRHVAKFMLVARYMGSRAAVICGASIEDRRPADRPWIDLRTGIFHGLPEGQRETKKRRQEVPVPAPLLAHLRRWRRRGQRYAVEWNGRPVTRVDKAHRAAVKAAKIGKRVTPHVWRHSVATWLANKSTPAEIAARYLAMSTETYNRTYAKHDPARFKDVHEALR